MNSLVIKKLPGYFLITCLLLSLIALLYILQPFLQIILLSAVLTISFYGIYKFFLKLFRGYSSIASLVSCAIVLLVIVVPIVLLSILVANEAIDTYKLIQVRFDSGEYDRWLELGGSGVQNFYAEYVQPLVGTHIQDLKTSILDMAQKFSSFLATQIGNFVFNILNLVVGFLIILFTMFYFFKDGNRIMEKMAKLSPLPRSHEEELFKKITTMVKAITLGVFLTALIEGAIGGIGFAIVGIPNPIFWATMMAFLSLLPLVGPALIWVSAAIILFMNGQIAAGIFIVIWGVVAIGSVEYILRSYFIGHKAKTYPLMIFFVVLGGIWMMGFKGIIVGPLVLMLFMAFLHIYEMEYKRILK